jgi:hypothetical protein
MGTVEAIVSDNVIPEFKLNVVKRDGSTLGDFSAAVEQAMQLWINAQPGNEQSADLKNATVSDDIIQEFKLQIRKRIGDRLGDLSSAVSKATQPWIKNDEVEEIKQSVLKIISSAHFADETKPLIDALKSKGKAAIPALNEIVRSDRLHSDEEEYVGNAIKEIMEA